MWCTLCLMWAHKYKLTTLSPDNTPMTMAHGAVSTLRAHDPVYRFILRTYIVSFCDVEVICTVHCAHTQSQIPIHCPLVGTFVLGAF